MKNETPLVTVPSRSSLRKHAFYGILALVSLAELGMTQSARAFNVTLQQVGSNVVATGSGAFDLTGLTPSGQGPSSLGIEPNSAFIVIGGITLDIYFGLIGPPSFGGGFFTGADTSSGDRVGINGLAGALGVPVGYASGTFLSDSMTFNNTNFATLGVDPGTYVWTWGDGGANQNFTLEIGSVPDGGSTVSLLGFALLGVAVLRRKLRC